MNLISLILNSIILSIIFLITYTAITGTIYNNLTDKSADATQKIADTQSSIATMAKTKTSIEYLTSEYDSIIAKLNSGTATNGTSTFRTNELNNFLTKLKSIIPTEVKLVSLENTEQRHIVIQARAAKYQQLGYFKALLEAETQEGSSYKSILSNVKASTGIRYHDDTLDEDYILITIEGDLTE